jgi:NhaA family Na+:H+ antiporter
MTDQRVSGSQARLPKAPIDHVVNPVSRVLQIESASGIVLLLFTLAALLIANSSAAEWFESIWETEVGFLIGNFEMHHSIRHWINDGLMVVFFFFVGLEVKHELVLGELRDLRAAALPIAAALGGMIIPALLYLSIEWNQPGARGWGIPMATDIAFVVGCLAVLGSRVPHSARVLLLSLAIADDIGAILVIAIGYTAELNLVALGWGILGIGLVVLLAKLGVRSILLYVIIGVGIWGGTHESGIHATIAGVILGLLTPVSAWVNHSMLAQFVQEISDQMQHDSWHHEHERQALLRSVEKAVRETNSPLVRLESSLRPWVNFVIMPLFALANAGVAIKFEAFRDPIALAVSLGLVLGKPLGIVTFSWLAIRAGLAKRPADISWNVLIASGVLAGIGFTMSLFIAGLALDHAQLDAAKIGVLAGSGISAILGMLLLVWFLPRNPSKPVVHPVEN